MCIGGNGIKTLDYRRGELEPTTDGDVIVDEVNNGMDLAACYLLRPLQNRILVIW